MWKKADLHHHTHMDKDETRQRNLKSVNKILKSFYKASGNLIAITDHDKVSFETIEEYRKEIEKLSYNINVLAGVELGFTFNFSREKKAVDLTLVFEPNSEEKLKQEHDIIFGDYKNNCSYDDEFPKIVRALKKNEIKFYAIASFNKAEENIDYEVLQENYSKVIVAFDLLEGKYSTPKQIERVNTAIKFLYSETSVNKPIIMGTDANDLASFEKNLNNVPWLYDIKGFDDIALLSDFPKTRIKFEKPKVVENYIKAIIIKDDDKNNEYSLKLKPGLNTIIGRRGTGKSVLANALKQYGKSQEYIKKIKLDIKGVVSSDKIKMIKQNELADSITELVKNLEDSKILNPTFKDLELDTAEFSNLINLIKENRNSVISGFKELFISNRKLIEFKKDKNIMEKVVKILKTFHKVLSINSNEEHINFLREDLKKIKNIKKDLKLNSPWLKQKINSIHTQLEKFQELPKYKTKTQKPIIKILDNISLELEKTELGSPIIKQQTLPKEIIDNVVLLYKNKNETIKNVKKLEDVYYKILASEIELNSNDTKINDLKSYIIVKFADNDITFPEFAQEFLSGCFTGKLRNDKYTLIDLLELNSRKNGLTKIEDKLFSSKKAFEYDGKRIDNKSVGQKHEIFIKKQLSHNKEIIILDQPDDDLDSLTIQKEIISKINDWGFTKQIIVVTHDPKIVINADTQSWILANFDGNKNWSTNNYKNITLKELKEFGYKIIDAKKEYPRIRYKKYGGYNENK